MLRESQQPASLLPVFCVCQPSLPVSKAMYGKVYLGFWFHGLSPWLLPFLGSEASGGGEGLLD